MFEWKREAKNSEEDVMRDYDYHMLYFPFLFLARSSLFSYNHPHLCIYIVLCSDSWCCVADCKTNHPLNYSGMCSWAVL